MVENLAHVSHLLATPNDKPHTHKYHGDARDLRVGTAVAMTCPDYLPRPDI